MSTADLGTGKEDQSSKGGKEGEANSIGLEKGRRSRTNSGNEKEK